MEGKDPHALGDAGPEQPLHPFGHLLGRLVGEGDGQDLVGAEALLSDQIGDAVRQGSRLAGARAGDDQDGPFGVKDRLSLNGVQPLQKGGFGDI